MFNPFNKIPSMKPEEVAEKVGDVQVGFVDVRSPMEYNMGHAKGAVNMPLETIPENVEKLKSYKEVYLICQSGGRSGQATTHLLDKGVNAINVLGGTSSWRALGLPLE